MRPFIGDAPKAREILRRQRKAEDELIRCERIVGDMVEPESITATTRLALDAIRAAVIVSDAWLNVNRTQT